MKQKTPSLINGVLPAYGKYYNEDWKDRAFHEFQQRERNTTARERAAALQQMGLMASQPIIYTRYVYWRDSDGTTHGVMVDATSRYKATFGALRRAVLDGYTRPKWWQFWRWNEKNLWIDDCDHQNTVRYGMDRGNELSDRL